jgi:Transglutaminase-like superfamily
MSTTAKTINILVFLLWMALLSLLLYKEFSGTPLEKNQILKGALEKVITWYDIYTGSKKIGFAKTAYEKVGDEIIVTHAREMKVFKNGVETVLFHTLRCLTNLDYSIKSFEYASHFMDEEGIKVTGEVDNENVLFFLESQEKKKTLKTPVKGKSFYFPLTFMPALVSKSPSADSVFVIPVLDLVSLSIQDVRVSVEEIKPIKSGINILSLYKLKVGNTVFWCNEKGVIIKEEDPSGITLYSGSEAIATDPSDREIFDYTSLPFFKSNEIIPNAESLTRLKVRIKGFSLDTKLYERSLVTLKDGILTIEKDDPEAMKKRSYGLPYRDKIPSGYTDADKWVQSNDKNVKGNALHMAAVEKNDAFRLARYLNSDLYFSVMTAPTFVLMNSNDLFKSRYGDYIGKTVMFASFARAAGLPTRVIGGLVYRGGFFYFHAWPEVWIDRWVPVDPTLAQFPADVTHIPLKEGTLKDVTSIVYELKPIAIEVLEAS